MQGTLESQYTFLLVNATSGPVFDRNLAGDQNRQSIPRTKKAVRGDLNIRLSEPKHAMESAFGDPGNFACGNGNPGLWNPEHSSRNPELH